MNWQTVTSSIIIFCGAALMLSSIIKLRASFKATSFVPAQSRFSVIRFLKLHRSLMAFFLLGYIIVALAFLFGLQFVGELFVSAIFFFGAVFVFLGIMLQSRMFSEIQVTVYNQEDALKDLRALNQEQEQRGERLERHTRYLKATAVVARDATSVLDPQELLSRAVTLVSEQFGFYHAGIFLLDESGEWTVLQAASSEEGRRMLAHGHRLEVGGESVVGYVTGRGEPRIALDIGKDAGYFNPDLPETRSEMALPLQARGEIIGALDVQSKEPEAFSEEDVAMLQTLADQVAMAISNARLLQQVQESLEAEQRAYGELSRQAWRGLLRARRDLGVLRDKRGISPASGLWRPEMETVLQTGKTTLGDGDRTGLAMPIKVRGQVIGVIDAHKPDGAGEWTSEEVALMETLIEQLGVALESARLYQDTQRRAVHEQLTREITDKMRRATGVEDIVRTAVDELSRVLGTSRTFARLGVTPALQSELRDEATGQAVQSDGKAKS